MTYRQTSGIHDPSQTNVLKWNVAFGAKAGRNQQPHGARVARASENDKAFECFFFGWPRFDDVDWEAVKELRAVPPYKPQAFLAWLAGEG